MKFSCLGTRVGYKYQNKSVATFPSCEHVPKDSQHSSHIEKMCGVNYGNNSILVVPGLAIHSKNPHIKNEPWVILTFYFLGCRDRKVSKMIIM